MADLELWGGPECTINRVGDHFSDQFCHSGHYDREADLDLLAGLGLSAVRYPILWERLHRDDATEIAWDWHDARLNKLAALGVRPIAGLVHHGSGPRHTSLLSPAFAPGLADHAQRVAGRYPWIAEWTPVNEPVTTARFSALYGHWYPHHRDEKSFWLALLNQIDAVRLAMRAIRKVNAAARLVQTEDLGRTYATARLRDQAAFDNVRRWASWDLLFGRVDRHHPFWRRLERLGFGDRLRAIADDPCPPDTIGINHYLTSDRFLDHRVARYPASSYGANARARYADVEAIRVLDPPPPGLAGTVREAWQRYGVPIAITEVHNGCTRDEQMRWLADAWDVATGLRDSGVPVQAVTSWALFGSAGWNTLLTGSGQYEIGAYDVSKGTPRPTQMVSLLQGLKQGAPRHPVLGGRGWWRRPVRILHPTVARPAPLAHFVPDPIRQRPEPPILILGAETVIGDAIARAAAHRDIRYVTAEGVADPASLVDRHAPWAVLDADAIAPGVATATVATVVGAARDAPVEPDDAREGRLDMRTSDLFSAHDPACFAMRVLRALRAGQRFAAAGDRIGSPTYLPQMADRALDLVIDGETGSWHLAGDTILSDAAFAVMLASAAGLDPALIDVTTGEPGCTALTSARSGAVGSLEDAIADFVRHAMRHRDRAAAPPPRVTPPEPVAVPV